MIQTVTNRDHMYLWESGEVRIRNIHVTKSGDIKSQCSLMYLIGTVTFCDANAVVEPPLSETLLNLYHHWPLFEFIDELPLTSSFLKAGRFMSVDIGYNNDIDPCLDLSFVSVIWKSKQQQQSKSFFSILNGCNLKLCTNTVAATYPSSILCFWKQSIIR